MNVAVAAVLAATSLACIDVSTLQSRQRPTDADGSTTDADGSTSDADGSTSDADGSTTDADGPPVTCDPGCLASACTSPIGDGTTSLVSGLESGCPLIDRVDGRDGNWFDYGNGDSIVSPTPGGPFVASCIGAGGSCHSACISGRIAGNNYPYAMLAFNFRLAPSPYDFSAYRAVSFYLFGQVGQQSEVRFAIRLAGDSDPGTGGTCMTGCNDPYQFTFGPGALPSDWEKYEVPFTNLRQKGFGVPMAWDPRTGIGMSWSVVAGPGQMVVTGDDYTLCVDQVEFLPN